MTSHKANIRAHSAFIAVAAILSLMSLPACSGAADATPGATQSAKPVMHVEAASQIDAGRYLVKIGGCHDCHTPGYGMSGGTAPAEADGLTGDSVGFSGPWGVTYPVNLRLSFQNMDEEQFLELAHAGNGRPPMPWPSLKSMSDQDLKAIYAYIHSLGPKGVVAPAALSPGVAPDRPHIAFVPQMPAITAK